MRYYFKNLEDGGLGLSPNPLEGYIEIELTKEQLSEIRQNYYKYKVSSDNTLVIDKEKEKSFLKEQNTELFKNFRKQAFTAWDILKTNVAVGLESPLLQEEIDWYYTMKDFPSQITENTTRSDYPQTPERVVSYL